MDPDVPKLVFVDPDVPKLVSVDPDVPKLVYVDPDVPKLVNPGHCLIDIPSLPENGPRCP